jgi:hypothetical protein
VASARLSETPPRRHERALDGKKANVSERAPDRFLSEDGRTGWYAHEPDGSRLGGKDEPWLPPPPGSVIKLMGEYTVEVPLRSDQDGLMFSDTKELIAEFGVSRQLADDLASWGIGWETRAGQPEHDAEAARLV